LGQPSAIKNEPRAVQRAAGIKVIDEAAPYPRIGNLSACSFPQRGRSPASTWAAIAGLRCQRKPDLAGTCGSVAEVVERGLDKATFGADGIASRFDIIPDESAICSVACRDVQLHLRLPTAALEAGERPPIPRTEED
jgi:hypothetical protein